MTGKERLFAALRHQPLDSVPWVPFAGVHAGKFKGYTAREVLTNADRLLESLLEVNRVYAPDGQPVLFDLQVEAEILGGDLYWAEETPPTVVSHPLEHSLTIPDRLPDETSGRLPLILDVMRRMKTAVGDHTALYGLVTGPFTLAAHLRGTDIFTDMFDHPDFVHELIAYTNRVAARMSELYIAAGMDVIAVVDPMVSQISKRHFSSLLSDPFTRLFGLIRARGAFSSFFVCGDATRNIEVMCQTHPDCISIDENVDMVAAKAITDRYNITIGGNIPLTTVMLLGTQQDNMKFTVDLLEKLGTHNVIISPGCEMPYDTPFENTIGVMEAVRNPARIRESLRDYHAAEIDLESVILPDYAHLERPLIEVFTLDSDSCAACMYMWAAARHVGEALGGAVDLVEYKFNNRENIARCVKMGIKNLPSIYINGRLEYSSIIPSSEELRRKIEQYL